jgi:hypothetical protein
MDNMSNIFRLVNLGVGGVMVFGGISQFFPLGLQSIIIGCYVILFGLGMSLFLRAVLVGVRCLGTTRLTVGRVVG